MLELKPRHLQALRFIQAYWAEHHRTPTLEQVAEGVGLKGGRGSAHYVCVQLTNDGWLAPRAKHSHRALMLTDAAKQLLADLIMEKEVS